MDHLKVIKRAWHILWQYRALWIFGIILALTTASGQASGAGGAGGRDDNNGNGESFSYNFDEDRWEIDDGVKENFSEGMKEIVKFFENTTLDTIRNWAITIGIILLCTFIILYIIGRIAHYVSETAIIQMVNDYEETGEQHSMRQGFRIGWSRTSWRLFFIDLLVEVPSTVIFIVLFALSLAPMLLLITEQVFLSIIGVISGVGLFFLTILLAIITNVALSLLKKFVKRACVLGKLGVMDSFRSGFAAIKHNLKDVGIMWLIMFAIRIGYRILTIPIAFVLFLSAVVFGGLAALIVGGLGGLVLSGATPWIMAGVIGIPIFILVMAVPMVFLGGLRMVFISSSWTLTYLELESLSLLEADAPLALDEPNSEEDLDANDEISSEK